LFHLWVFFCICYFGAALLLVSIFFCHVRIRPCLQLVEDCAASAGVGELKVGIDLEDIPRELLGDRESVSVLQFELSFV